jgi:hypothetical protein
VESRERKWKEERKEKAWYDWILWERVWNCVVIYIRCVMLSFHTHFACQIDGTFLAHTYRVVPSLSPSFILFLERVFLFSRQKHHPFLYQRNSLNIQNTKLLYTEIYITFFSVLFFWSHSPSHAGFWYMLYTHSHTLYTDIRGKRDRWYIRWEIEMKFILFPSSIRVFVMSVVCSIGSSLSLFLIPNYKSLIFRFSLSSRRPFIF